MSLGGGRQLHLETRRGGRQGAGDTPPRHAPAANGSLPKSPVLLCCAGCPGGQQGTQEREALPSSGLKRKVLVPGCWGDTRRLLAAGRAWGAGRKQGHRILGALSLRAGPASALLPQGHVWGGPESTPSQTSPLIKKQKASLWEKSGAGRLVGEAALSRLRRSCQPFAQAQG